MLAKQPDLLVFAHSWKEETVLRQPEHSLSYEYVVLFLTSYTQQNAVLPGRIPGYSWSDIKLLPSSVSKSKRHMESIPQCCQGEC